MKCATCEKPAFPGGDQCLVCGPYPGGDGRRGAVVCAPPTTLALPILVQAIVTFGNVVIRRLPDGNWHAAPLTDFEAELRERIDAERRAPSPREQLATERPATEPRCGRQIKRTVLLVVALAVGCWAAIRAGSTPDPWLSIALVAWSVVGWMVGSTRSLDQRQEKS